MKDKIKFIKALAESMNENKINSVKYEDSNFEIQITKEKEKEKKQVIYGGSQPVVANNNQTTVEEVQVETPKVENVTKEEEITGTKVDSPMVGTFYAAPSPNSEPFIKEGDKVSEGQTLCIVEAMKLMNEVKSPVSGTVKKILVKDATPIKKGQTLVIID